MVPSVFGTGMHGRALVARPSLHLSSALPHLHCRPAHRELAGRRRLDDARRKALAVDLIDVRRVERVLVEALEQSEEQEHPQPLPPGRFTRPGSVFAFTHHSTTGGRS